MSRLLVVDEDPRVRSLVADQLRPMHDVAEEESAAQALDRLGRAGGGFNAMVVPWMEAAGLRVEGVDLIRSVFQRWPWIPIVVLAGLQADERVRAELAASTVHEVLAWPVNGVALGEAVARAARRGERRTSVPPAVVARIREALAFIGAQSPRVPRLGELAGRAAMSRSTFSRAFNATVGMSLRRYLAELRLQRATGLLLTTGLSLTAIAAETGFFDLAHLDKAFRRRFGSRPSDFRRRLRAGGVHAPAQGPSPRRRPGSAA